MITIFLCILILPLIVQPDYSNTYFNGKVKCKASSYVFKEVLCGITCIHLLLSISNCDNACVGYISLIRAEYARRQQ